VICGHKGDLDAHEEWEFDIRQKTQTLKNIVALCSACHGVKHMRNTERLGYGENAKNHFLRINKCDAMAFANHYAEAQILFDCRNEVLRWKVVADLAKFGGGEGIEIKRRHIPFIQNPYKKTGTEPLNRMDSVDGIHPFPMVWSLEINNYEGTVRVVSYCANKILWLVDDKVVKTHYNIGGIFASTFCVENVEGTRVRFVLVGDGGKNISLPLQLTDTGGG